ncbi:LacI family DNA-binding transcriptional regulator [uncultured Kriegella sp.]|uniref:LacI family DNA-binding transcriptional regulator n=1 Tax=uncultured Kriegella sp. TaxID=1798910 RepID=UPI0030D7929B|tara:strand:+ start:31131 stop:32141 length:1011 start_codon:yes stop_codon:yes gene_type:complete
MRGKITIYDIAKKLNITAATVSRALNNNPKISEATRKKVLAMANEMHYEQNKLALALKSGKSNTVGVVVPFIDRNFFSSIIRGIEEELYPKGYHVIICQSQEDEKKELKNFNALLNAQIDGLMVSVSKNTKNFDHFDHVLQKKVPIIFFDRKVDMKGVSTVTLDDFQAGYEATKHLIVNGSKRIAHLSGDWALDIYQRRMAGYKQALVDHNIKCPKGYVVKGQSDIHAGKKAVKKLMKLNPRPDAIFSASDFAALGAIQQLKEMGLRIPEDVKVVGFSNEPFTKFMELPITTVDQSPMKMGKMAAEVFLEQVKNTKVLLEKSVVIEPKLKIRKSSL